MDGVNCLKETTCVNQMPATPLQRLIYNALISAADAHIITSKATMSIYVESPVGIGEHPQHLEEITKLLDAIATAEDRKAMLARHFANKYGPEQ